MTRLRTERLLLRRWRDEDRAPFAALCADPVVMEHFPALLSRAECDAAVERFEAGCDERGFGFLAVERRDDGAFLGFVGLSVPGFEAPFQPCVEIGWRLAREHHGHGYAQEAARAWLAHGFEVRGLEEIVSFTATTNANSERVMRRLGMRPDGEFDHPALEPGHRLRRHVLYRLGRADWRAGRERATGLRLRRADPERDVDAFRTVRLAALAMDPGAFESSLERERDRPPEAWQRRLQEERVFFLDTDFGPRGLVIGARDPDDASRAFLLSLWVEPDLRGQGAARTLVAAVRDDARASGFRELVLHVAEENAAARALYDRFGFREAGSVALPGAGGRIELEYRLPLVD